MTARMACTARGRWLVVITARARWLLVVFTPFISFFRYVFLVFPRNEEKVLQRYELSFTQQWLRE